MPAERLDATPTTVRKFDVGGQDSDEVTEFVRHVGLSLEDSDSLTRLSTLRLVHMGPPLEADATEDAAPVEAVATAHLTADEILQIQIFVDELISEYEAERARPKRQYVIRPHAVDPDETLPFRRFNCAGFAIEAYRDAGIELIYVDDESLPSVSLTTLKQAYPDQADRLDNELLRAAYGLAGVGPWPVVLAGYVINALARDVEVIRAEPYKAIIGDEFFPARSGENAQSP